MTELSLDLPGNHLFIRSVNEQGIKVGDQLLTQAAIISPQKVLNDWQPPDFDQLKEEHFQLILGLEPELVLLGTGARQKFAHPSKWAPFYAAGIGIEVMTTEAACRTFNLLAAEDRNVVAALLPIKATNA